MVNSVMGRSGENEFNYRVKFFDVFCMDPELIENGYLVANEEYKWIKTHEHHREKENDFNMLCPSQTEGNG